MLPYPRNAWWFPQATGTRVLLLTGHGREARASEGHDRREPKEAAFQAVQVPCEERFLQPKKSTEAEPLTFTGL